MKKVSILIPLYNAENYIEETIQSALNQTYPATEIIIVDDGSTDNSLDRAKKYESEKVKVFSQQNKGACAARNLAFEKSVGDYIQYLDADDLLAPDKIEVQLGSIPSHSEGTLFSCSWSHFSTRQDVFKEDCPVLYKSYENPVDWLADSWLGNGMFPYHVWLSPRKLIEKAGLWNNSLLLNQDGEFFSRVLAEAESIHFCPETSVYYRKSNPNSISQGGKFSREKANSLLNSYRLYIKNTEEHHANTLLQKALGNNLLMFIYQYYHLFPDLCKEAEVSFYSLGFKEKWPVGGALFKKVASIFGFEPALRLKILLQN